MVNLSTRNEDPADEPAALASEPAQLFLPGDCSAQLPTARARQRNVYWRITAIDTEIDLTPLVDDKKPPAKQVKPGVASVRLGLPLGVVSKAWSDIVRVAGTPTVHNVPVTASADGTFLPATDAVALTARGDDAVQVALLDTLEDGTFRHGKGTLRISADAIPVLLEYGQAFAQSLDDHGQEGALVRVRLDATEVDLENDAVVGNRVAVTVDNTTRLLGLDRRQRSRLLAGRDVTIRDGARALRLMPPERASRGLSPARYSINSVFRDYLGDSVDSVTELPEGFELEAGWGRPARPLPRYEIGLATAIVQEWSLIGYERGQLVGSVVLEPGAEATLEVFTWERLRIEREEQTGTTFERTREVNSLSRTTSRIAIDAATELGTTMSFGGGATIPIEAVSAKLDAGVETQTAIDTTVQSGLERVVEATAKSTEKFQMTHQVKVVHTMERGSESRSTRKVRNPNTGRTLEFLHFEIQERHSVTTGVRGPARLVVFVANPTLGAFDTTFVLAHRHVLERVLLSDTYLPGLAAAELLHAQGWFESSLKKREEEAAAAIAVGIVTPPAPSEAPAAAAPITGIYQTARQIQDVLTEFTGVRLENEAAVLIANLNPFLPDEEKPSRSRVKKAEARFARWSFWVKFTTAYPGIEDKANTFIGVSIDGATPATQEEIVAALQQLTDGLDDDWLVTIKMIAIATVAGVATSMLGGPVAGVLQPILIGLLLLSDDMGLPAAITRARRELPAERALQQGQSLVTATPDPTNAGASGPAPMVAPPQIVQDRELAEAQTSGTPLKITVEEGAVQAVLIL